MKYDRNVTINTVAEAAGVSKSTVSRVISDSPEISSKTKEKVFSIMDELGYYPSAIARSLANRKSKNIGLVLPRDEEFFINPFFQQSLRAISMMASNLGYDLLIIYNEDTEIASIKRVVNANKVDGVILMRSVIHDESVDYLKKKKIPFVLIGSSLDYDDIYSVDTDNIRASKQLSEMLYDRGARIIAFIGGDRDSVVTIDRFEGYKRMLEEKGILYNEKLVESSHYSRSSGSESIERIISQNLDLDAVIITDPLMSEGAIDYIYSSGYIESLEERNKKLYVATFASQFSRHIHSECVKLLNVDVNCKSLGELSCKKLIDLLESREVNQMDYVDYIIK